GAQPDDAVETLAVRLAPRLGKLMPEIDDAMPSELQVAVMQRRTHSRDDVVHLRAPRCEGPDVQSNDVLVPFLATGTPVPDRALAKRHIGVCGATRHVIVNPPAAQCREHAGISPERLVD